MENCIFCKIIKGEIESYKVFENENFIAFLDINPINPGHLDIVPKQHHGYIFDLPDDLYREIFEIAKKLSLPLQEVTKAKRIGMAVEGFGVDHVHLHLVPINKGNELDPNRAKQATSEELGKMLLMIKSYPLDEG